MNRTDFTPEEADVAFKLLDKALADHPLPQQGRTQLRYATADEFMLMHEDPGGRLHFKHSQTRNYLILHAGSVFIPTGGPFQEGVF